MDSFDEQIKNHSSLSLAKELNNLFDSMERLDLDAQCRESMHRLRRVNEHFLSAAFSADPELTSFQALRSIEQALNKIKQEISAFKNDKNINHLNNANTSADQILMNLRGLWVPVKDLDLEQVRDAISSFRKSVGQNSRYVEQELQETRKEGKSLRSELQELQKSIEEQKVRADSVINELQSQFSKSEESRREEFSNFLKEEKGNIDGVVAELENKNESFFASWRDKFNNLMNEADSDSREVLGDLERFKRQAEQLVHVITNTGMVGGFQRVANEERRAGRFWDAVSLFSLVGMVGFAIYAFKGAFQEFEVGVFLARFGVVLTFGALAGYSARQADKHHKVERRNRRVELELASIDPFLAELPESERNKVKTAVADRLFARESEESLGFVKENVSAPSAKVSGG